MSAKLRMTGWIILIMLIQAALVLTFVLVINNNAITDDPAGRVVKVVMRNYRRVEFDNGEFQWDDMKLYSRGVYCTFYDRDGKELKGAKEEGVDLGLALEENIIRTVNIDGEDYFVYDMYQDMEVGGIWIRGVINANDRSGLMKTIMTLTFTLLPALIILSGVGGWLVAYFALKPMENIMAAANSISDGGDLTARVNLKRGPSEMRRLSQAFDRMFERLEKSFNAERQFTSDASHELRTPITVILADCDRAKRKCVTKEDFIESIDEIEEQTQGMSALVHELLSLTRIQYGTDKYPMRKSDLSLFVESCCGEFMPEDEKGIRLATNIEPNIELAFNSALMSRVVQNLLQNAYKYGKENGNIILTLHKHGDEAVLAVQDDGIGIAPENQDKIWQRFWQADPSRGEDGGSGLGLAMVHEIADFHHGSVKVESEPDKGSCFIFTIPM